ncbi:MAG: prepilin peptidase [Gammaproteobacteria bacterium]|nr:MAG: prepilin peptidase [Gammaproteobacteria bacterium]
MQALYTALQAEPWLQLLAAFLLGLVVGSFLNVVIHRLPRMLEREWRQQCAELTGEPAGAEMEGRYNLVFPSSHCPHCAHPVGPLENIPLLSYLLLRGRCRACGHPIGLRYPAVELLSGICSAAVVWHFGLSLPAAGALILTWGLIALTFIDADTQLLPDDLTLPLLWLGLLLNIPGSFVPLPDAVIGAVAGYLSLWSVYWLFRLLTGKEGMGHGDFKLLALIGAWLGWQVLPLVIILSSLVGSVIGIGLMLLRSLRRDQPIPFGPYLAIAGWIALIWGDEILRAWLG